MSLAVCCVAAWLVNEQRQEENDIGKESGKEGGRRLVEEGRGGGKGGRDSEEEEKRSGWLKEGDGERKGRRVGRTMNLTE